jgi:hypothetical protein
MKPRKAEFLLGHIWFESGQSKAPAVSLSFAKKRTLLEAFIAPLPPRDIAFDEREICFHIARLDSSAPRFVRSRTLDFPFDQQHSPRLQVHIVASLSSSWSPLSNN